VKLISGPGKRPQQLMPTIKSSGSRSRYILGALSYILGAFRYFFGALRYIIGALRYIIGALMY